MFNFYTAIDDHLHAALLSDRDAFWADDAELQPQRPCTYASRFLGNAGDDTRSTEHIDDVNLQRDVAQGRIAGLSEDCLLYTSPSPRDGLLSRMPSSA